MRRTVHIYRRGLNFIGDTRTTILADMTTNEWLTLLAIVLGPIGAVGITLFIEHSRKIKERRVLIVRMLLATRHMPADAQYNTAVNLIPADFNDQPKVMAAWRRYHAAARERHDKDGQADHQKRLNAAQSSMIFEVMRSVGLEMSEGDIQTEAYVSEGFVERDKIYMESLRALPELAAAMKAQVEFTRPIFENLRKAQEQQSRAPPPGE